MKNLVEFLNPVNESIFSLEEIVEHLTDDMARVIDDAEDVDDGIIEWLDDFMKLFTDNFKDIKLGSNLVYWVEENKEKLQGD